MAISDEFMANGTTERRAITKSVEFIATITVLAGTQRQVRSAGPVSLAYFVYSASHMKSSGWQLISRPPWTNALIHILTERVRLVTSICTYTLVLWYK